MTGQSETARLNTAFSCGLFGAVATSRRPREVRHRPPSSFDRNPRILAACSRYRTCRSEKPVIAAKSLTGAFGAVFIASRRRRTTGSESACGMSIVFSFTGVALNHANEMAGRTQRGRPGTDEWMRPPVRPPCALSSRNGGPDRDRTGDLMNAIHARSQLRYWPTLRVSDH
jgi:hypothetical protein